ncbi:hypothetical protein C1N92_20560 [Bacillus velezensis]|uniref:YopX family protein n=1 Tax=Bacillus velezensis TaxID=492670 RepID=UPI000D733C80|nr:YopX family protein [Bacillus velezensis]AWQ17091.1 hypothetical protein C1N92_20560 [Bacillus velezensis]
MREIKFRMYSKKKKVMHYWDHIKQFQLAALDDNDENEKYSSWMQYTVMKDKYHREIYEGDIIQDVDGFHWRVYWKDGSFWAKGGEMNDDQHLIELESVWWDVAGNIYEDSELLETE